MASGPGSNGGENGGLPPETFIQGGRRVTSAGGDMEMDPERIRFAMNLPIQADRVAAVWQQYPAILKVFSEAMTASGRLPVAQEAALFRLITNPLITQNDVAGMQWLDFRDAAAGGQELTNGRGFCRELLDKVFPPVGFKR